MAWHCVAEVAAVLKGSSLKKPRGQSSADEMVWLGIGARVTV